MERRVGKFQLVEHELWGAINTMKGADDGFFKPLIAGQPGDLPAKHLVDNAIKSAAPSVRLASSQL